MSYKSLSFRLLLLLLFALCNVSCGVDYMLKRADKRYARGEYYAAAGMYKHAISAISSKNKPLRGETSYKMGNCYRLYGNNIKALTAYRNAIRFKVPQNDVYLFYADVLAKSEQYKEARSNYYHYLRFDSTNVWALNGVYACNHAKEWKKMPARFSVKEETHINSRRGDDFSAISANDDGSLIYFTSSRVKKGQKKNKKANKPSKITGLKTNDIFMIKRNKKGNWDVAESLPEQINTDYDEGASCLSFDGKTMYFTRCSSIPGQDNVAQIYCSKRSGGEWSEAKLVKLVADTTVSVAHPAVSPDGNYLYFVSDMKGGQGGNDIWRCKKKGENEWENPQNLGPGINTLGSEMFPTFSADGILYFSSNGLPGLGGLDIFAAKEMKADSTKELIWIVKNLLTPINSSGDDFGLSFIGRSKTDGYFSSNRNDPKGYDKIYSFGEPKVEFAVKGKVTDNNGDPISDAVIRIVGDDGTNAKVHVKKDGSYLYRLNKEVNYLMQATARGHLNEKANFSTVNVRKTQSFTNDFELPSMRKPVTIDNIFYDFGRYTLTKESEVALNGLVKMMNDNPHITIELRSHTDMIGSDEANMTLSTKRAESVVNYLIRAGIDENRLTYKGYGESEPVTITEALSVQYPFFKVGDVLNETFVSKLPQKQQEVANQINRRTEFVVLKTTYKMF